MFNDSWMLYMNKWKNPFCKFNGMYEESHFSDKYNTADGLKTTKVEWFTTTIQDPTKISFTSTKNYKRLIMSQLVRVKNN